MIHQGDIVCLDLSSNPYVVLNVCLNVKTPYGLYHTLHRDSLMTHLHHCNSLPVWLVFSWLTSSGISLASQPEGLSIRVPGLEQTIGAGLIQFCVPGCEGEEGTLKLIVFSPQGPVPAFPRNDPQLWLLTGFKSVSTWRLYQNKVPLHYHWRGEKWGEEMGFGEDAAFLPCMCNIFDCCSLWGKKKKKINQT